MPIPTPSGKGKKAKQTYISHCIETLTKSDTKRPASQIAAICYTTWKKKSERHESKGDFETIQFESDDYETYYKTQY